MAALDQLGRPYRIAPTVRVLDPDTREVIETREYEGTWFEADGTEVRDPARIAELEAARVAAVEDQN